VRLPSTPSPVPPLNPPLFVKQICFVFCLQNCLRTLHWMRVKCQHHPRLLLLLRRTTTSRIHPADDGQPTPWQQNCDTVWRLIMHLCFFLDNDCTGHSTKRLHCWSPGGVTVKFQDREVQLPLGSLPWLPLGWVTACGQVNYVSISL